MKFNLFVLAFLVAAVAAEPIPHSGAGHEIKEGIVEVGEGVHDIVHGIGHGIHHVGHEIKEGVILTAEEIAGFFIYLTGAIKAKAALCIAKKKAEIQWLKCKKREFKRYVVLAELKIKGKLQDAKQYLKDQEEIVIDAFIEWKAAHAAEYNSYKDKCYKKYPSEYDYSKGY